MTVEPRTAIRMDDPDAPRSGGGILRRPLVEFGPEIAADLPNAVRREWLVTNGLGGYASGTVAGVATRRYHGLLVAALPSPFGRTMMFNHLNKLVRLPDGTVRRLGG